MEDINIKQILENENPKEEPILLKKSSIFMKSKKCRELKILILKQMLQRLLIALAQLKAGNTPENLLNEIRQIVYSLHLAKEITKKYIAI